MFIENRKNQKEMTRRRRDQDDDRVGGNDYINLYVDETSGVSLGNIWEANERGKSFFFWKGGGVPSKGF